MNSIYVKEEAKAIIPKTYKYELLNDFVKKVPLPSVPNVKRRHQYVFLTRADFKFYHSGCDGHSDFNTGSAYRTLQTMISWLLKKYRHNKLHVPDIKEIQKIIVTTQDKPPIFMRSRDWIGALEMYYIMDYLYDVPCKLLYISNRWDIYKHMKTFIDYFIQYGGFIIMGGDTDAESKSIAGILSASTEHFFLIVDPHYSGETASVEDLIKQGYIRWLNIAELDECSFFTFCFPCIH